MSNALERSKKIQQTELAPLSREECTKSSEEISAVSVENPDRKPN